MNDTITFYPLGNADTTLIELANGKKILFDYANMKNSEDEKDKRCDLPKELNKSVKGDYDVVAFTHADKDHIKGFSDYFFLEHEKKYQEDERKKIDDLWVPAAIILETTLDNPEAEILRSEARYRLKNKKRIKVFSKPDKLKVWLKQEGIEFEEVSHLFVNAGTLVPGWVLSECGIEFFVHSPFSEHIDDKEIERNEACIIVQAVFNNAHNTAMILGADADSDLLDSVIDVTKFYKREKRLEWDIFHLPHHSSYKSINVSERGESKTTPTKNVKWLFEEKGRSICIKISPSWEIPVKCGETQPPHKEAANYYKDVACLLKGEYKVTMEHPTKEDPKPMKIVIDDDGFTLEKISPSLAFISNKPAPKAG